MRMKQKENDHKWNEVLQSKKMLNSHSFCVLKKASYLSNFNKNYKTKFQIKRNND